MTHSLTRHHVDNLLSQTSSAVQEPVTVVQCADGEGEAAFIAETAARLAACHGVAYGDMAILYRSNPRQCASAVCYLVGRVRFYFGCD